MSEWQPIETAPRDGTIFFALNHDQEVWVAKYIADGSLGDRLAYRTNKLWEPKHYAVHDIDGKRLLEELPPKEPEAWHSHWTYWSRGYEFKPTKWLPCPLPSVSLKSKGSDDAQ